MRKSLIRWQLAGFLFTGTWGTLFHFLYDWSGKNGLVAAVSAVNESTWEHMKLLFFPMLLFALVEYLFIGGRHQNFWFSKGVGALLGLTLIPVIFYTWNGALGPSPDWGNISIFFVAAAAAYVWETRLLIGQKGEGKGLQTAALAFLLLLALTFVVWTYAPPQLPLFRNPLTGGYSMEIS